MIAELRAQIAALQSENERLKETALTWQEALAIIEEDLTDKPSRAPAATTAIDKCVGILEAHDAALLEESRE